MLSVAFIPAKGQSSRIPSKNLQEINGESLIKIAVKKVLRANCFADVYVDTESEEIWKEVEGLGCKLFCRPKYLATNKASANDLLLECSKHIDFSFYDSIFQIHCTAPFLRSETLFYAAEFLNSNKEEYDSIFPVEIYHQYSWMLSKNKRAIPLYDSIEMPPSQQMPLFYKETHGFYGITAQAFNKTKIRFGKHPHLFTNYKKGEEIDINTEEDLEFARILAGTILRSYL